MMISGALEDPSYDLIGVYDHDSGQREELREATETMKDIESGLNGEGSLEDVEEEINEVTSYSGQFDYGVGDRIDRVAKMSECVLDYLDNYDRGVGEFMPVSEVLAPLEEYNTELQYNENEGVVVEGDAGLQFVSNTIGLNGVQHGKESDDYQMWVDVQDRDTDVLVHFWDNGTGLTDDLHPEEIFQKNKGNGTGKGLYMAREITELFGGNLRFNGDLAEREDGFGMDIVLQKPE